MATEQPGRYPPHPVMAKALGIPGNEACSCPTPMAAMFCSEGHMLECHQGMSCEEARCSHFEQDSGDEKEFDGEL